MKSVICRLSILFTGVLFASSSFAQTFAPQFDNDVGAAFSASGFTRNGTIYTFSGDCTGIVNCGDYFDVNLQAGDQVLLSFCPDVGGDGSTYDPSLAIYRLDDLVNPVASNDDNCAVGGLNSTINYTVTSTFTYRVALGTFSVGQGGPYTLAVSVDPAFAPIPTTDQWALVLMILLMLGIGFTTARRRNQI